MFAPRRVGKTFFLDHDLAPAAREIGLLPVYADLWLQRPAPLAAINHALEEALADAFLKDFAEHFAKVHRGPKPLLVDLRRVFSKISFKPALMKDIVKSLSLAFSRTTAK